MISARIRCVTFIDGEATELEADGKIEFTQAFTRLSFAADSYTLSVRAERDRAVVARTGDEPYTAVLEKGCVHPLESPSVKADVCTDELKWKRTENAFSFFAVYALSQGEPIKLFITAKPRSDIPRVSMHAQPRRKK